MKKGSSFLNRKIPLPGPISRFLGDNTIRVRRAGAIAGLMEGTAIAGYDVLMDDLSIFPLLQAILFVASNALIHFVIWTALGTLLNKFIKNEDWVFRICVILFAVVVAVGRDMLGDRTVGWAFNLWAGGLVLVFVAPFHRHGKFWDQLNPVLEVVAVCLITVMSLAGRVPDYSFPIDEMIRLMVTCAAIGIVAYAAAVRAQPALALALALLLALGFLPVVFEEKSEKPNVLFILVDTLRRDHVSPFGDFVQSPAIEKLTEQATLFDNTVTVIPKTTSSIASIFTGRYPTNHGVRTLYSRLGGGLPVLAEVFAENGYKTEAFVNNAWLSRGRGFAQGFERFNDFYNIEGGFGPYKYGSWAVLFDRLFTKRIRRFDGQTSAHAITDSVLDNLADVGDKPFFTYVHYFEPHWPYFPPEEQAARYSAPKEGKCLVNFIEQAGMDRGLMIFQNYLPEKENEAARRLYRGECDDTLAEVGRLLEGLDKLGLEKDTLVVFTADHGHSLGEHDYYFHHGEFLYDASLRIPLIMRWPGRLPAGRTVNGQARTIDILPTILALLGIETQFEMDGKSLLRYLEQDEPRSFDAFIESDVKMFPANTRRGLTGITGKLRAVRTDEYKLIMNPTHKGPRFELYKLGDDPEELKDLAGDPELKNIMNGMKRRLYGYLPKKERNVLLGMGGGSKAKGQPVPTPEPDSAPADVSETELEMLRALGYVQ